MQFLVSRLASPTMVDFDDDGRNDTLSVDDQIMSPQSLRTSVLPSVGLQQQQRDGAKKVYHSAETDSMRRVEEQQKYAGPQAACAERFRDTSVLSLLQPQGDQKSGVGSIPSVAPQRDLIGQKADCAQNSCYSNVTVAAQQLDCTARHCDSATADMSYDHTGVGQKSHSAGKSCCAAASSDTESTMSLNELLDGCQSGTDAGETCAVDGCDAGECGQPTVSRLCEIVNILHVSVDADAAHNDGVLQISENSPTRLGLSSSRPGKFVCSGDELTGHDQSSSVMERQMHADCQAVSSPQMQRRFAESNLSSSSLSCDKAHVDEGYHSNATSALSQEAATYDDTNSVTAAVLSVSV